METFTDPAKCLPVLEADQNGNAIVANAVKVSDIIPENDLSSFIIPAPEVKKLEGTVPVIVNTDPIISNNHYSIFATAATINDRLTNSFTKISGTSIDAMALEEFQCKDSKTKGKLQGLLSFMFESDIDGLFTMSYADTIRHIAKTFRFETLEDELVRFIRFKLTKDFNDFLVNNVGFNPDPNGQNSLSSSDILEDIDDVMALFEKNDLSLFEYLDGTNFRSSLQRKICMFTEDELEMESVEEVQTGENGKEEKVTVERPVKLSPMDQLKFDTTLNVLNRIHITTVNKTPSPLYTGSGTVTIKRSTFPEIFAIIEDGFKNTYGDELAFSEIDKVIRFSHDDNRWVFSRSIYDENVGILRHMALGSDLFMLEFN